MKILCGGAQCGHYLGDVGPSVVGMKSAPVWRIDPGWQWRFPLGVRGQPLGSAILEFVGEPRPELQLAHEAFGVHRIGDSRVSIAREVNLPIVVRCPKCHRLRYVPLDVLSRAIIPA